MLKVVVEKLLVLHEIPRKSGKYSDYEKGKAILKKNVSASVYNNALNILKKWIGI